MDYKITRLEPFGVLLEPNGENTNIRDLDVENLRELFHKEHLLLLRGFETFTNMDDFPDYCASWGEVSIWPFGKVLELIQQDNPKDHIFDHSYVPIHWDGMYRPQVPEYQIFHCVQAPLRGQGGRTTFCNTVSTLKNACAESVELWNKVTGVYQRKMEFYNSKTVSPVVVKHPHRDFSVIRYNEPHMKENGDLINPVDMEFTGINKDELTLFHRSLKEALFAKDNFYAHEWQTGDVVIADNLSLLHGREEFVSKSPRHIRRVQVLSNPPYDNPGLESYK